MIYRTVLLSIFVVIGISTIETNGQSKSSKCISKLSRLVLV